MLQNKTNCSTLCRYHSVDNVLDIMVLNFPLTACLKVFWPFRNHTSPLTQKASHKIYSQSEFSNRKDLDTDIFVGERWKWHDRLRCRRRSRRIWWCRWSGLNKHRQDVVVDSVHHIAKNSFGCCFRRIGLTYQAGRGTVFKAESYHSLSYITILGSASNL